MNTKYFKKVLAIEVLDNKEKMIQELSTIICIFNIWAEKYNNDYDKEVRKVSLELNTLKAQYEDEEKIKYY